MNQPIHLVVGTPCYGGLITAPNFTSGLNLREYCAKNGIQLSFAMPWGDALVTRARQSIAAHFLEDPTATHLLFIDADITYGVDQVLRLLNSKHEVCAGLYPAKKYDWDAVRQKALAGEKDLAAAGLSYVYDYKEPLTLQNGFAQVTRVGTGFLLIQRSVLESMAQKYPELKYKVPGPRGEKEQTAFFQCLVDEQGLYLSEDYSFCKRWTDMGGAIWADFQSRLGHLGPEMFQGDLSPRQPGAEP